MGMSAGAVLVGVGALVVVVAYVARPFRVALSKDSVDRAIEAWVEQARREMAGAEGERDEGRGEGVSEEAAAMNFCPQCGRRVAAEDVYCSGCGVRLRGG